MIWDRLSTIYKRSGIVLVLGAGVSVNSGLPNWSGLLQRLVTDSIGRGDNDLFGDLYSHGITLPVIASILEEHSSDRTEFIEQVREALYRDFPFFPDGITKINRRKLVEGRS
jgi:hypothetical protein